MVYQVRDIAGRKILERQTAGEIRYFLKDRPQQFYEVWVLDSEPPSDLKGVYSASEFVLGMQREATQ